MQPAYEEFMKALEGLQKQGLKKLIFDLRGNGGGYMDEAIDIADEFLDGEKLIVYTEGVKQQERENTDVKDPACLKKGNLSFL